MTTKAENKVHEARKRLEEAQADYKAALEEFTVEEQFPVKDTLYAVVSAEAEFHQFVSYPEDRVKLIAVFQNVERADRFIDTNKPPQGRVFFVRDVPLRS